MTFLIPLLTSKLFGPPTGGILRERPNGYKCWSQRENDYELNSATLREMNASSEWPANTKEDAIMLEKAWDFAYRWRSLTRAPPIGFLRNLFGQDVMNAMARIDYLAHVSSGHDIDPIALDARYEEHLFEHNYEYPCAPWLQYDGEDEPEPMSEEICAAAKSCDACAALSGCGWCSTWTNSTNGHCTAKDSGCETFDRHLCHTTLVGAFTCGPCTGGTEAVMQISSRLNQMGVRNVFGTVCAKKLAQCGYDVPFLRMVDPQANTPLPSPVSFWTCMGCNSAAWRKVYLPHVQHEASARKYLVALGHHKGLFRRFKMKGWTTTWLFHNEYALAFECGIKGLSSGIGTFWYENEMPLESLERLKENIVVHDADSKVDWDCARANAIDPKSGERTEFDVKPLRGMSREQWKSLAQKAKVMVDLEMPGYEFGNLEASLNGAVFVPSAHGAVRNHRDFAIPDSDKIYMDGPVKPCVAIGRRIGAILSDWRTQAEKQNRFRKIVKKIRNQEWINSLNFFQDDVSVVMNGYSHEAYELSYAVAFMGLFAYPHASFEVVRFAQNEAYYDFNAAFDFYNEYVHGASIVQTNFRPPVSHDDTVLLAPITSQRLFVCFLPVGYLPVSKNIFGFLATELERRKHRHWLICPDTGLVFARQWWHRANQAKLTDAMKQLDVSKQMNLPNLRVTLFKTAFGSEEVERASLDQGRIRSFGAFLRES